MDASFPFHSLLINAQKTNNLKIPTSKCLQHICEIKTWELDSLSSARICVYLQINSPLPVQIKLNLEKDSLAYVQNLDYENLPFRCCICSEYGHLAKACPLAQKEISTPIPPNDGFQEPKRRHQASKKSSAATDSRSTNRFHCLQTDEIPEELIPQSENTQVPPPVTSQQTFQPDVSPKDSALQSGIAPPENPSLSFGDSHNQNLQALGIVTNPSHLRDLSEQPTQETNISMEDQPQFNQELVNPETTLNSGPYNNNKTSSIPIIKQTPSYLKATVVGQRKSKGRISNQTKRNQEAMASIEEGSQARLEEVLATKKQQVSQ